MSQIVKGDTTKGKQKVKLAVGVTVATALLALTGFGVYQMYVSNKLAKEEGDTGATQTRQETDFEAAYRISSGGDYAGGQKMLDDNIQSTDPSNKETLSRLYLSKATVAANAGNIDEAIEFAKKSEELGQTNGTSSYLGNLYERKGDKAMALKYYQLTQDRYPADQKEKISSEYELLLQSIERVSQ